VYHVSVRLHEGNLIFSDTGSQVSGQRVNCCLLGAYSCRLTWLHAAAAGIDLFLFHLALHWLQLKFPVTNEACDTAYDIEVFASNTAGLVSSTIKYPTVFNTPPW
jgi:hypothetical protein